MVNVKQVKLGRNTRMSFSKINEVQKMPNLIEIQKDSYKWFLDEGIKEVFKDISSITDAIPYNSNWKCPEIRRPRSAPAARRWAPQS